LHLRSIEHLDISKRDQDEAAEKYALIALIVVIQQCSINIQRERFTAVCGQPLLRVMEYVSSVMQTRKR